MRFYALYILSWGIALTAPAWTDDLGPQHTSLLDLERSWNNPGVSDGFSSTNSALSPDDRFGLMRPSAEAAGRDREAGSQEVCYKLRTYTVKRDDQYRDSTEIVGYSTCQPASRYSLRRVRPVSPLK
jgi:hypothetical protein